MVNDNAPALFEIHSTQEKAIQDSSIERQISLQESIIKEKQQTIVEAEKTIVSANSDISLAKNLLSHLKKFEVATPGSIKTEIKNKALSTLSKKEMTLEIIKQTNAKKGIMIPEIKELMMEKYGLSVSPTTIDDKTQELVQEGHIYQVNEGRQRGKKYLAKNI